MEALAVATASLPFCNNKSNNNININIRRNYRKLCSFRSRTRKLTVCYAAANGGGGGGGEKMDKWDQMELKFGQLIGEDPQLTLAKIRGRKSDPDVSYLEIEKSFYKKKGKSIDIEEVPFDVSDGKKQSDPMNGLNLVRPVPKKGVKFQTDNKPIKSRIKVPNQPVQKPEINRNTIPNIILRKPTTFSEDDIVLKESPKLSIKPNLLLRMGKEQTKEKFTDMTLLKKPEHMISSLNLDDSEEVPRVTKSDATKEPTLLSQPKKLDLKLNEIQGSSNDNNKSTSSDGLNLLKDSTRTSNYADSQEADIASLSEDSELDFAREPQQSDAESAETLTAALIGKPIRLDQTAKETGNLGRQQSAVLTSDHNRNGAELENFATSLPIKEYEEGDWKRVEDLVKTSGRDDVELISCSTRGFVVSFGSLIGFLPYRNLSTRWKFLAFESWLRRKGLDPSKYKQNLGIIGSSGIPNETSLDTNEDPEKDVKVDAQISPDTKLEDLLRLYDKEKLEFLSSFVGQKIKVNVTLADRKSRRLIFSLRPKEKEETVDKKRTLMAKLTVGDVVKCLIKKITYFGIFVEVEGVPALIHQTEVSWDATLDPASYFKVGQIVDAKVHQLDFSLGRIFLSLKEITPDPLIEALEAVIGDKNTLDGRLEAAEEDTEWDDVESLIKELQKFEQIESVKKGRFFRSPGLAPTFQVYMASMFKDEYKLLARAGNKVQEVIVQTSLDKEGMKSAILTCTNRVE